MKSVNEPFFSVIIPAYNRRQMTANAVRSALDQHITTREVIVVDDGSTDHTMESLSELFGSHPDVKLIRQANLERGAARNTGIRAASGQYLVFLDSDDILHKDHLLVLLEAIRRNPGIKMLAARYVFSDGKNVFSSDLDRVAQGFHGIELLLKGNPFACNICIISDHELIPFLEDPGFASMEDWLFILKNFPPKGILVLPDRTIIMNDHPGRSMKGNNLELIRRRMKASRWAQEHLPLADSQKRTLAAWSSYFASVHAYLDHNRALSLRYIISAVREGGLNLAFAVMFLKALAGRSVIKTLKG